MQKAVADKNNALTESFQFRDLRAKSASDDTPESATARLGHSDPRADRAYLPSKTSHGAAATLVFWTKVVFFGQIERHATA